MSPSSHWDPLGLGSVVSYYDVCLRILEVVQSSLSICSEHKIVNKIKYGPMASSLPRILLMLYSELACAREDRDGITVTLSPHISSSCSLLGKKHCHHVPCYYPVRCMIHLTWTLHRELFKGVQQIVRAIRCVPRIAV